MKKSRLEGHRIYLAGTMEHAKDDGVGWRRKVSPMLEELGLNVLDPTARPVQLSYADSAGEELSLLKSLRSSGDHDRLVAYVQEIVHQDLRMVDISDIILVHIDASVPTVGTIDEFVTATNQRKPIMLSTTGGLNEVPLWFWGRVGTNWDQSIYPSIDASVEKLQKIAYCSDRELDEVVDRKRWFFLGGI